MIKLMTPPGNMPAAPDYTMTVDGTPVYLCELPGWAGGTIAIAFFEMDTPAAIEIQCRNKVKTASVHPLSAGIDACVRDGVVSFIVDKPQNLCVFFNDSFALPVYLFVSPPHTAPDEDNPDVLYYKAGIHHIGHLQLRSGQTLWLDDGAVLCGTVFASDASDIQIRGRGIIRTSHIPFGGASTEAREVIGFVRCKNINVEGITILDSFSWTVVTYDCDNVHIDNVRIINERPFSTDGINPCNSAHVLIENCFIRSKDDCITIKGFNAYNRPCSGKKPVEDIVVRSCVFWCDNNNAMVVGNETLAEYVRDIHFRNCDVLKAAGTCGDNAGVMSVICLHDGDVSDISFEDIRVEYTEAPLINVFYTNEIFRIPGMRRDGGGIVRNILFRDISLTGGPMRWSYIRGMDETRTVEDVTIQNLCLFGKQVTTAQDAELETMYVRNLKIL